MTKLPEGLGKPPVYSTRFPTQLVKKKKKAFYHTLLLIASTMQQRVYLIENNSTYYNEKAFQKDQNYCNYDDDNYQSQKKKQLRKSFSIRTSTSMFFMNNTNTFFANNRCRITKLVTLSTTLSTRLTNSTLNSSLSKRQTLNSAVVVVTKCFYSTTSFIIILNDAKSLLLSRKSFAISNRKFLLILKKSKSYVRSFQSILRQNSILNFDVTSN